VKTQKKSNERETNERRSKGKENWTEEDKPEKIDEELELNRIIP
jgi:hypothetical protein